MQSAYDRDDYVTIAWDNITPGLEHNFNKYTNLQVTHFNTTYDYYSVMHYGPDAFSKNGQPTIVANVSHLKKCFQFFFSPNDFLPIFVFHRTKNTIK